MLRIIQIMVFIPAVIIMLSHCESFEPERKMLLETNEVRDITLTSCSVHGYIYDIGEDGIKEHGFCWSTNNDPRIEDNISNEGPLDKAGSISSRITDLSFCTTYYIRAYSISSNGKVAYGNVLQFITDDGVTDKDGNVYNIVTIGNQTWMKENLKTTHYADGSSISDGINAGDITNDFTSRYYFANCNDDENIPIYGRLYTWAAVMNGGESSNSNPSYIQGICPTGWHVPSDEEWKELEMYLGLSLYEANNLFDRGTNEGGKLKSTEYFWEPNTGATNESGFTAVPGGDRGPDGHFNYIGGFGVYWSCTQADASTVYIRGLDYNKSTINRWNHLKHFGFSVRCVLD